MKKRYVTPSANLIELKMNENIAAESDNGSGLLQGGYKFENTGGEGHCFELVTGIAPSGYQECTTVAEVIAKGYNHQDFVTQLTAQYFYEYDQNFTKAAAAMTTLNHLCGRS